MIKQADLVLAMFLLGDASRRSEETQLRLLRPVDDGQFIVVVMRRGDHCRANRRREKAIRYGMAALLMDLADVGGNVKDGCHIASMAGTWMMLTYGFGGMRDDNGTLSSWPRRAPRTMPCFGFP